MSTIESQLSAQVIGNLAADILAPNPAALGLIQASQYVDPTVPKGKTRITVNWTAPTVNEFIGGELFKNPDGTASLASGAAGATHETQFDPIVAGSFSVYERTAVSANIASLKASTVHGQRIVNIGTPVPSDIIFGALIVIDDGVASTEEYVQVKAVNTLTGDITLTDGLFFPHASGATVKAATLLLKTVTSQYALDVNFGVLTEQAGGFTAGNKIVIRYQTVLQDLDHYELYRVPGNAVVAIPTKANVLAAAGLIQVSTAIPATATAFQDQTPLDADNGANFTYYIFALDHNGNASNLTSEVMTQNLHLVLVETFPSIAQNPSVVTGMNQVVVSWPAVADPNASGYNVYRSPSSTFNPAQAVKLNSSLIPKGTGTISFDDSANNVSNRVASSVVPYPASGSAYTYKLETEDTVTFWTQGTTNIPTLQATASKTAGVGDGTGGR
ncbi:MAG: hypothetical protein ACYCPQ_00615 [Elusimicrobiota bacterium]